MNLTHLPDSLIQPLRTLTKQPPVNAPPASQDEYDSFEPQIALFLANNALKSLPRALFEVENIRVLSIRGNNLEELPGAIERLVNLEELNLGFNEVRYLPRELVELLRLGKLKRLRLHPNPFVMPSEVELQGVSSAKPLCHARSKLQLFDKRGSNWKQPHSPARTPRQAKLESKETLKPTTRSLLEMATQECARSSFVSELHSLLPEDVPTSVARLVSLAADVTAQGGRLCSICRRSYIIPRTEWIEWWRLDRLHREENWGPLTIEETKMRSLAIPVVSRGCSWNCTPVDA